MCEVGTPFCNKIYSLMKSDAEVTFAAFFRSLNQIRKHVTRNRTNHLTFEPENPFKLITHILFIIRQRTNFIYHIWNVDP